MKCYRAHIKVRDLIDGFTQDDKTGAVRAYHGRLDIRPPYQREFVYTLEQSQAVIRTIMRGLPLNVMYWVRTPFGDDTWEVLDGQQRSLSICKFFIKDFHMDFRGFHNLTDEERETFLNYDLHVYQCDGTDKEALDWFRTVNISGTPLTDQELLNATYAGPWVTDAKKYFSKVGGPFEGLAKDFMAGNCLRQDFLEKVISWKADLDGVDHRQYMADHQHDTSAMQLWLYANSVIQWVQSTFPQYRKEMRGVPWGFLYNRHKDDHVDPEILEERIICLMEDEDVTNKKGIYDYVLSGDERSLSVRRFSDRMKREAYERQRHVCPRCQEEGNNNEYKLEEMEADHIKPWREGGTTVADNCQMLCKMHNRKKGGK